MMIVDMDDMIGKTFTGTTSPVKCVLATFPIAHLGWEMDNEGAVVLLENGTKKLILTNHCSPHVADKTELQRIMSRYIRELGKMQAALDILNED